MIRKPNNQEFIRRWNRVHRGFHEYRLREREEAIAKAIKHEKNERDYPAYTDDLMESAMCALSDEEE
jgi:hypothetical protein